MVMPSMRRHDALHGYIATFLRDTLAEELARAPSKTRKASYECITSVVYLLQSVFSSAVRDFSEEWAAAHVDPLMALPSELVAQCFAYLNLRERIAVSHVSQAWRRFALAQRTLWSEYDVPPEEVPAETVVLALEVLLARSHPAPFRLTYFSGDDTATEDCILDVALQNMERMRSITLSSGAALPRLFDPSLALHAPRLKRLDFGSWGKTAQLAAIPAQWAARCAPHLEVLILGQFSLSPGCAPFTTLRTLKAYLPEEVFPRDLSFSTVFPNLRQLELGGVAQHSLPMLTPLPPFLNTVLLWARGAPDAIDYSQFVQACAGHKRIHRFKISRASHFSDALELFLRMSTGRWTMHMRDERLQLEDAACGMDWEINCRRLISLARESSCVAAAHLERLGDLTLSLTLFLELHKLGVRVLPALHSLALFIITDDDIEAGRSFARVDADSSTTQQLSMPALRSLKFLPGNDTDFDSWLTEDAPVFLPPLLRGSTLPLVTIYLRIVGMPHLSSEHRDGLFPFARRIVVESASFPGMRELVLDSEEHHEKA